MRICAISDCHGELPKLEPCDLVLICGDIVPLDIQRSATESWIWYNTTFKHWTEELLCNKVLFIAGNHEIGLYRQRMRFYDLFPEDSKVTYLEDDLYIYEYENRRYSIYGTPWCQIFGRWAYMLPDEQLEKMYLGIPYNLDILMTHDAPYGVSDILLQEGYYTGEHIGNKPLAEAILQKAPKIVCHGHLHSTSREFELLGDTKVVNCSLKDENYQPVYEPLYLNIDK